MDSLGYSAEKLFTNSMLTLCMRNSNTSLVSPTNRLFISSVRLPTFVCLNLIITFIIYYYEMTGSRLYSGHSIGGIVAAYVAEHIAEHPDLAIRRVIIPRVVTIGSPFRGSVLMYWAKLFPCIFSKRLKQLSPGMYLCARANARSVIDECSVFVCTDMFVCHGSFSSF